MIAPQTSKIDPRRIVSSMNNLVQDELQLEVWHTWTYSKLLCSHRGLSHYPSVSDHKSSSRSNTLSPCDVHNLVIYGDDVVKFDFWCFESPEPSGTSGFPEHPWYSVATGFTVLMTDFSWDFWSLSVATSFPVLMKSWASLCHPWELDAASGLEFLYVLASGLPDNPTCRLEALSISGLLDAIGLFKDEEPLAWISPQSCCLLIVFLHPFCSTWRSATSFPVLMNPWFY